MATVATRLAELSSKADALLDKHQRVLSKLGLSVAFNRCTLATKYWLPLPSGNELSNGGTSSGGRLLARALEDGVGCLDRFDVVATQSFADTGAEQVDDDTTAPLTMSLHEIPPILNAFAVAVREVTEIIDQCRDSYESSSEDDEKVYLGASPHASTDMRQTALGDVGSLSNLHDPSKSFSSSETTYPQSDANDRNEHLIDNSTDMPPWDYSEFGLDFGEILHQRSIDQSMSRPPSPSMSIDSLLYGASEGSQYTAPSSVSGYSSYSGLQPADRPMRKSNQYGPSVSPPWKFRPEFGGFVYKRSTDQIVPRVGQPYRRPMHIPVDSLLHAVWEGFQYTGSPPTSTSGLTLQSGPPGFRPPNVQVPVGQTRAGPSQPFHPHNLPNIAGQLNQPHVQEGDGGPIPRVQEIHVQTREFQQNGQRLRQTFDPRSSVATLNLAPEQPTSESSLGQTRASRQSRGGRNETRETLYPDYKIHPARFFVVGRIFLVLWSEPSGGADTVFSRYEVLNQFNERVFSKVRRFVVVREGSRYCCALPISTYSGQGVAKPRVVKSDHAIIYTGPEAPLPRRAEFPSRGEAPMRSIPIRVNMDNASEKLDPMCRINFGGLHMIQHNVKTRSFGTVHKDSLADLQLQFNSVFNKVPMAARLNLDRGKVHNDQQAGSSGALVVAGTAGATESAVCDGESEEEEEDDDEIVDEDEDEEADSVDGEAEEEDEDEDEIEGNVAEEDSDSDDE